MDTYVICTYDNSPSRTRTYDSAVNSRVLYRLSYRGISYQDYLSDYLNYYIRFFPFVKYFFSDLCSLQRYALYHVPYNMSSTFFKFFSKLFLSCFYCVQVPNRDLYSSSSSTAAATLETALETATTTATIITSAIRTTKSGNAFPPCCASVC